MRILVRLEGFLAAQFWIEKEIDVPEEITLRETILILLKMLQLGSYKNEQGIDLSSLHEFAIFVLNGKESSLETILSDGDVISVFSPLSGGWIRKKLIYLKCYPLQDIFEHP